MHSHIAKDIPVAKAEEARPLGYCLLRSNCGKAVLLQLTFPLVDADADAWLALKHRRPAESPTAPQTAPTMHRRPLRLLLALAFTLLLPPAHARGKRRDMYAQWRPNIKACVCPKTKQKLLVNVFLTTDVSWPLR